MSYLTKPNKNGSIRHRSANALKILGVFLAILLLFLQVACSPKEGSPGGSIAQEVTRLIESINPSQPGTLSIPEQIIELGRPAAPVMIELIDSKDIIERWAATYYFSRLAEPGDMEKLAIGLKDPDLSLRATVAATLLRLGDDQGLSVLQEASKSDEVMLFSEPPVLLSEYANWVLKELASSPGAAPYYATLMRFTGNEADIFLFPDDIEVKLNGCYVDVVLNLQFSGAGASQALADTWAAAITQMWDGRTTKNCCKIRMKVNVKVGGQTDADYAQITVVAIPVGARHTSNATLGESQYSGDLQGEWDTNDTGPVAAHEAGHLMGVKDDYYHDAAGNFHRTDEAISEARAGSPDIMAQTWPENGNKPVTKTRHGNQILKAYGIVCPPNCLEECLPKVAPPPTTTPPPSLPPPPTTTTPPPTTTTPPPTTTTPPPTTTTPPPTTTTPPPTTTTPPPTTTTPPPTTTTPPPTTTTPPPTTTTPPPTTTTTPPPTTTTPPPDDLVATGYLQIPLTMSANSVGPPCTSTVAVSYSATIGGDFDISITNVTATITGKAEENSGSISTEYYHNSFSVSAACGEEVTLTVSVTLSNGQTYFNTGSVTTPVPE